MKKLLISTVTAVTLSVAAFSAHAQTFPTKLVRVVVPFPPGGSFDVIARDIGSKLSAMWKQPVVVDNRAGAGGNIGAQNVLNSAADGYTLLFWGDGVLANPLLYSKPPFDAIRDFSGVSLVATAPQVLVANSKSNLKTINDLMTSTTPLNYGTAGSGTPGHLAAELLREKGARQLTHVPYRGGGPALTDLLGGQIQLVSTGLPACITQIKAGAIRAIAVTSKERYKILPDVPTVAETVPGYEVDTWFGFMAPKATPLALREKIAADIHTVMEDPAFRQKLIDGGFLPATDTPSELDAKMEKDLVFWRDLVQKSGARAE